MPDAYSHRAVWKIAAPMIVSSVTVPLLGMVDTAVMGHLPASYYLGAVAAGSTVFTVLFMGMNFLRMGTTGITAQSFGADDNDAVREALGQPLVMAAVLAAGILILQKPLIQVGLWLLAPSANVAFLAQQYFDVRVWSAPASLCNFVLIGWLLGMQNARAPLVIMLTINVTNIVLDLFFVLGLGMTVRGVAMATVLAEIAGAMAGLYFVASSLAAHPGNWSRVRLGDLSRYKRLFDVNASLFVRTMSLMFVFAFITSQGARMGDVILAANAVLMNFQLFLSYALDGIAYAAEALVGKALGGKDRQGVLTAVQRTLQWSVLFAILLCAVYWIAGQYVIDLLTGIDAVRQAAREFMPWLIVSPLISVWAFLYDGVFVGLTRSKEMLAIMAGSAFLVFLPTWFGSQALGNHGLWLAFTLFMVSRSVGMHVWFRRIAAQSL